MLKKAEKELDWKLLTLMKTNLFAIAKITTASGLKGEVNLRPLIRQFQDYVSNDLYVGFDKSVASDIKIANVSGSVNKPRFHFEGLHSRNDASFLECKPSKWKRGLFTEPETLAILISLATLLSKPTYRSLLT